VNGNLGKYEGRHETVLHEATQPEASATVYVTI
jgi:hypothetical protein